MTSNLEAGQRVFERDTMHLSADTGATLEVILSLNRVGDFFQGRPEEGIGTLIDNYVTAPEEKKAEHRQMLLTGLVGFAQKINFLANNEILMQEAGGERTESLESRAYNRLLQAISNSILVQVDELHHRESHEKGRFDAWRREVGAASKLIPADAAGVIDHVLQQLNTELEEAKVSGVAARGRQDASAKHAKKARDDRGRLLAGPPLGLPFDPNDPPGSPAALTLAAAIRDIRVKADPTRKALDAAEKEYEAAKNKLDEAKKKLAATLDPVALKKAVTDAQTKLDEARAKLDMSAENKEDPKLIQAVANAETELQDAKAKRIKNADRESLKDYVTELQQKLAKIKDDRKAANDKRPIVDKAVAESYANFTKAESDLKLKPSDPELTTKKESAEAALNISKANQAKVKSDVDLAKAEEQAKQTLDEATVKLTSTPDPATLEREVQAAQDKFEKAREAARAGDTNLVLAAKVAEIELADKRAKRANNGDYVALKDAVAESQASVGIAQTTVDKARTDHELHSLKLKKLDEVDKLEQDEKVHADEEIREKALANSVNERADRLEAAKAIVGRYGKDWVRNQGHTEPHTHLVVDTLRTAVRNHIARLDKPLPKPEPGDTDKLTPALDILVARNFDLLSAADLAVTRTDPKNVLDLLVSELQYELIQAEKAAGKDSPRSRRIRDAIETAFAHRARMVYIRPPSAFLKNSYPVTSLQSNAGSEWNNMLGQHALRSLPYYSALSDQERRDGNTRNEIDKQFWQNINRVRVAGGGNTNYVIVKDDVGNWYVKGYSADPKPMIDAAKAVALGAMSGAMTSNLIAREAAIANAEATGQPIGAVPPATVLAPSGAAAKFHMRYRNQSIVHAKALGELAPAYMNGVKSAWDGDKTLDPVRPTLDAIAANNEDIAVRAKIKERADAAALTTVSDPDRGMAIVEELGKLRSNRDQVIARIVKARAAETDPTKQPLLEQASATAFKLMSDQINGFIKKRMVVVEEYQTAMEVLMDASR